VAERPPGRRRGRSGRRPARWCQDLGHRGRRAVRTGPVDYLLDVELLYALRGLVAGGHLSEERAADARSDFADLTIVRYEHTFLADRIWELGHNLTADDATFVALSEILEVPLVTCDRRLAAAPGHRARVELFDGE
jgi:predicted nucleic acid-binding protein